MKIKLTENKKKIIVLSCMVVLLVVAGTLSIVLNINMANKPGDEGGATQTTFYTELQSDRELRKNEQLALIDAIINNDNSTAEAIKAAEAEKLQIVANIETEMTLEAMIKSKGFANVAVLVGDEKINVFVDRAELTAEETSNICSIILEQTDFEVADIIINPTLAIQEWKLDKKYVI